MKSKFRLVVDVEASADNDAERAANIADAIATVERALADNAFDVISIRRQRCAGEAE